jgi:hypothetical protein
MDWATFWATFFYKRIRSPWTCKDGLCNEKNDDGQKSALLDELEFLK